MTSSLPPAVDTADSLHASTDLPTDPFAGLDGTDVSRIAAAMSAALAESTRAVYAHAWRCWERWCATRRISPLPAAPAAICAYLTERANEGASAGTLDGAGSAIAYQHRSHGLGDPVLHDGVRQVRRGLRRTLGTAPVRLARLLGVVEIRQIVAGIDRDTPKGARDAALILLGSPPRCDAPS
jgi:site-specific recombinase XerD